MADEPATDAPVEDAQTPAPPPEQPAAKEPEGEPAAEPDKPADKPDDAAKEPEAKPEEPEQPERPLTNNEAAQKRIQDRARLKQETQRAVSQAYQPQTVEQLEQQGYDPRDAQIEALRQQVEFNQFTSNVADLTANMNIDASSIEQDFDIFSEKSPNFDKAFAERVSREYIRDANVQFDETGQYVTSARIPMYDYYKSRYEDRTAGLRAGQVTGQKAAEKMLSAVDTPSSGSPPPPPPVDSIQKGFDAVFGS